jgi:hypothetical protein
MPSVSVTVECLRRPETVRPLPAASGIWLAHRCFSTQRNERPEGGDRTGLNAKIIPCGASTSARRQSIIAKKRYGGKETLVFGVCRAVGIEIKGGSARRQAPPRSQKLI